MAAGVILLILSALSFFYGITTESAATTALHQILAGIGILGGLIALAGAGTCFGLHSIVAELHTQHMQQPPQTTAALPIPRESAAEHGPDGSSAAAG